uniref:Ribosomal RNA-processing protein 14/surfeit locus protein 6 C-terminal domain-containing protein n=1 Tax=Compsopogon caeruleus TaxID=31354 RepID=A0A7S1XG61_9RHOD|mmetsp:Transcript_6032/g.11844  ORF Transcript_6032/g.11844 Transcript_6032/m.11844 type:complete len:329 (+) Transcript_6032:212-1198(+)
MGKTLAIPDEPFFISLKRTDEWIQRIVSLIPSSVFYLSPHQPDPSIKLNSKDRGKNANQHVPSNSTASRKNKRNSKVKARPANARRLAQGPTTNPADEALRSKLHDRVASFRAIRKADGGQAPSERLASNERKKASRKTPKKNTEKLGNRDGEADSCEVMDDKIGSVAKSHGARARVTHVVDPAAEVTEVGKGMDFNPLTGLDGDTTRAAGPRPRRQPLEKQLSKALKAKEGEARLAHTPEGKQILLERKVAMAMRKTRGEKVRDDPTLLKKSIKREARKKRKSAEAWKLRVKQQVRDQKDRQRKREENIRSRKEAKAARRSSKPRRR